MAIIATDNGGGGDFKPVPQGTHVAICNMVVDLGKQRREWQGQEKIQPQVFIHCIAAGKTWTHITGFQRREPGRQRASDNPSRTY